MAWTRTLHPSKDTALWKHVGSYRHDNTVVFLWHVRMHVGVDIRILSKAWWHLRTKFHATYEIKMPEQSVALCSSHMSSVVTANYAHRVYVVDCVFLNFLSFCKLGFFKGQVVQAEFFFDCLLDPWRWDIGCSETSVTTGLRCLSFQKCNLTEAEIWNYGSEYCLFVCLFVFVMTVMNIRFLK
jgi:hypothetical protein